MPRYVVSRPAIIEADNEAEAVAEYDRLLARPGLDSPLPDAVVGKADYPPPGDGGG